MKFTFSNLWRSDGTIDRREYLTLGAILFAIKYTLDRLVARAVFGHPWSLLDYFERSGVWEDPEKRAFYGTMIALAIPFIWMGTVLTVRRLRGAGLSPWLVAVFFIPLVNLIFFALLCFVPSRSAGTPPPSESSRTSAFLHRIIPETKWGSAVAANVAATLLTVSMVALSTSFLRTYGAGLFVGAPFCLGLFSVLIYGYHRPRKFGECLGVCFSSVLLSGAILLVVAMEGIFCLVMAAPLAMILAWIGGTVGYAILRGTWWKLDATKLFCAVILAGPAVIGFEQGGGL